MRSKILQSGRVVSQLHYRESGVCSAFEENCCIYIIRVAHPDRPRGNRPPLRNYLDDPPCIPLMSLSELVRHDRRFDA